LIDEVLETFKIKRSLSTKGCPYDNAVAEATMKAMKTEFVKQMQFDNLEQLETDLFDYVNWYSNFRPHCSLNISVYLLSFSITVLLFLLLCC
uniref:integrase core domain-containing protein n=1 Tax=Staphylococcus aureus TaxID=1280 RepID=UPI0015B62452